MRRALLALSAVLLIASSTGCSLTNGTGCRNCYADRLRGMQSDARRGDNCPPNLASHHHGQDLPAQYTGPYTGPVGPETATVTYPYYTLRGPRDFLVNDPPNIGR